MEAQNPFVLLDIGGDSRRFILESSAVHRIGRDSDNTIVIPDQGVSRHHAMIRRDRAGECFISDLGSRNGTTVNGRPVTTPIELSDGDRILIGQQAVYFHQPDSVQPRVTRNYAPTLMALESSLISVLVIDVRGYTMLARELGEARISAVMSHVFRAAGDILFRRRSRSQKYMGDAVMSVWLHEGTEIRAGELIEILGAISELREMFEDVQGLFDLPRPLTFGAGINSGFASFGNMGSAASADFTAMGDTVNKAFRLESTTKDLGCNVAIGRASIDLLMPPLPHPYRPPGADVTIKGYVAPEQLYPMTFDMLAPFAEQILAWT